MEEIKKIVKIIKEGGVVLIPTDTIKGLSADAFNSRAVDRIYQIKKRSKEKPFIILINNYQSLLKLGIKLSSEEKKILNKIWPGKVTVILNISDKKRSKELQYLHRGKNTLAVRMPKDIFLEQILDLTGPLVSTSANLAGEEEAVDVQEVFGNKIDYYFTTKKKILEKSNIPSRIIEIEAGQERIIRA